MNSTKITEVIYTSLKAEFDTLNWAIYPSREKLNKYHLPFANLELGEFVHIDVNSDLNEVEIQFTLRLAYSDETKEKLAIRDMALQMGCFISGNNFKNVHIKDTSVLANQSDEFSPEVDGYVAWEINFVVDVLFGETIYEQNCISREFELEIAENAN